MRRDGIYGTTELPDWLTRRAVDHPDVIALQAPDGTLTYGQLFNVATVFAARLQRIGVQAGTRIAVLTKSSFAYAKVVHGLMQCSAILVPLNWRLTAAELAWQVRDAGIDVLLYDDLLAELAITIQREVGQTLRMFDVVELASPVSVVDGQADYKHRTTTQLTDVHAIIYTSGTTGFPKGAMLTYNNHWWGAMASALQLGVDKADKWLIPMPLFHVGGLAVLMRSLIYGTTVVLHDGFDAERVNDALDHDGISLISVVPTMLQRMLAIRDGHSYPTSLRAVLLGGSGSPKSLIDTALALGVPVRQSYGMTETNTQVCTIQLQDAARKIGSSGKPLFTTEVAILRDYDIVTEPNVEGEIVVRGPTVTIGYYNCPDATECAFHGDWLRTGDIGYLDDEGFLFVLDRRSDLIVSGGENIYPAEIESVLLAHPLVEDAGVVGSEHDEWGQVPIAFVVLGKGQRIEIVELIAHCRSLLAKYKIPKDIQVVDELPRNASGKLMRKNLRQWLNK